MLILTEAPRGGYAAQAALAELEMAVVRDAALRAGAILGEGAMSDMIEFPDSATYARFSALLGGQNR